MRACRWRVVEPCIAFSHQARASAFAAAHACAPLLHITTNEHDATQTDVGNLLGGAGARSAHLRGIAAARSGKAHFYDHSEEERDEDKDGKHG